jgi:Uma2 family endonuclease
MNPTVTPHLPTPPDPGPRYWTREEYYRLADLGFFRGQRAERIGGQIMVMSPQNWPHTVSTDKSWEVLRAAFGSGFWVRSQAPLELGQSSDPEPEVSVGVGRRDDYSDHPTAAVLVVEVSDTTLAFDRGDKANQYAAAGITDYWVIDVNGRRVEVYRDPRPDPAKPFGAWYTKVAVYGATDAIAPLAAPAARLTAADLLP